MSIEDALSANSLVPAAPREVAVTSSHLVQRGFRLAVSELNPRLVEAYYDRGHNRALRCDYYQAIQDFTKVIEFDTPYAILHKVYRERGNAYKHLGKYEQAIQDFTQAIEADQQDWRAYFWRAGVYESLQEHQRCIQDLTAVLQRTPDNENAYTYYWLGEIYEKLGDRKTALKFHSKAIEIDDHEAEFHGYPTDSRISTLENRIKEYTKLIEKNPQDISSYRERVISYEDLEKTSCAINDYARIISLSNEDSSCYLRRGRLYVSLREFSKALDDADTYIKKNSGEWRGYHLRGWAHEMLGNYRQAIQDYSEIININAESDINYYRRGRCHEKLGEYQEAIESYSQIINMKQNNTLKNQSAGIIFYYYWRGWAYQHCGQDQQATQDFRLAAELGDTYAQRYLLLIKK